MVLDRPGTFLRSHFEVEVVEGKKPEERCGMEGEVLLREMEIITGILQRELDLSKSHEGSEG